MAAISVYCAFLGKDDFFCWEAVAETEAGADDSAGGTDAGSVEEMALLVLIILEIPLET